MPLQILHRGWSVQVLSQGPERRRVLEEMNLSTVKVVTSPVFGISLWTGDNESRGVG